MAIKPSIKINAGAWTLDYPQRSSVPGNAVLFGVWAKANIDIGTYPIYHVNFTTFATGGGNWSVKWIIDNLNITQDHSQIYYNANASAYANAELGGSDYIADYDWYESDKALTEAECTGWKYCACQLILDAANSRIIMRQWLKFGLAGTPIKTGDDTKTFTQLRADLVANAGWTQAAANAWTPDSLAFFQIGQTTSGDGTNDGNVIDAKIKSLATEPSISDINAMALNFSPDATMWGDYPLNWDAGAAVLTDRSGNGRNLTTSGTLYQGLDFDDGAGTTVAISEAASATETISETTNNSVEIIEDLIALDIISETYAGPGECIVIEAANAQDYVVGSVEYYVFVIESAIAGDSISIIESNQLYLGAYDISGTVLLGAYNLLNVLNLGVYA